MSKSVLITGCSDGGIGSALALAFEARGLHVYATARSMAKMASLEDRSNITRLELDVTSSESIAAVVQTISESTDGKLDYLVNNAAQTIVKPALDTNIEEAKRMYDVNLWGLIAVTQAFSPLIIASRGTIVNICSISSYLPVPYMSVYNASKAAVTTFSETLRVEMIPFGVKVVSVITGAVYTNMLGSWSPKFSLPEGSVYTYASKEVTARAKAEEDITKGTAEDYAKQVVEDVLGGASSMLYRGYGAKMSSYLWHYCPQWLMDRMLTKGTGLDRTPDGKPELPE